MSGTTTIGLLGDRDTGYVTHQALERCIELFPEGTRGVWIPTDDDTALEEAAKADGLWVVPGTPYRSDTTVYSAISQARLSDQPFLGTCGGFQYAAVEYARKVAGLPEAQHAETGPDAQFKIVDQLSCNLVGIESAVQAIHGTQLFDLYGAESFIGFHYCNFGLSERFIERLESSGLLISARGHKAGVEAFELPAHRFFIATLFQPQMSALEGAPLDPLISAFLEAASSSAT